MQVQLHWVDSSGKVRTPILNTPIAFGSSFGLMPGTVEGNSTSRMVLDSEQVDAFHALLSEQADGLMIQDRSSRNGTLVNGVALPSQSVAAGDRITIGPYEITIAASAMNLISPPESRLGENSEIAPQRSQEVSSSTKIPPTVLSSPMTAQTQGAPTTSQETWPQDLEGINSSEGFGSDGRCRRKVGFLFKRRCRRMTTEGCPDCRNGQIRPSQDLYADDYAYYPNYCYYGDGYWGDRYYRDRRSYTYNPETRNIDFNESDAASFEQEGNQDYELELDAS